MFLRKFWKYLHYTYNMKIRNVPGESNKFFIHTTNLYLQPANEITL